MTRTVIHRFGHKARVAVASAAIASGLLLATATGAGARGPEHCPADWDHSGVVGLGDLMLVVEQFGQSSLGDILPMGDSLGDSCPPK